jgi:UDP-N-acetylmuramoyl-tripeptide--D-alanyl-D-alanine ligase
MGMNHLGEIAALARIASPDWGVIANVGMAHAENFADGQAGIARAKFELVESLPATGIAFLNCDDPYVSQFGRDFAGRAVYFGRGPCADPQIIDVAEDANGLSIRYRAGDEERTLALKLVGAHNALNAMAALAVAREAGVEVERAAAALATLTPGDKRGETITLAGATILNDAYNSNPEALRSMIRTLASRPAERRILIAGEMLELGDHAPRLHGECGKAAAEAGIDLVVGVRGNANHIAAASCMAGVPSLFLPDAETAGHWLAENLRSGDVVLVKGSRGVRLEQAIETAKQLLSESSPAPATDLSS